MNLHGRRFSESAVVLRPCGDYGSMRRWHFNHFHVRRSKQYFVEGLHNLRGDIGHRNHVALLCV